PRDEGNSAPRRLRGPASTWINRDGHAAPARASFGGALTFSSSLGGAIIDRKIWFITGAGRGMGVDIAKAALAAGHAVVASGRDSRSVSTALGRSNDLLAVKLDVTSRADSAAAVRVGVERFGRIDVLVNNAANFYAGYFEELTPEQMERQLAASLTGPM